jgi:light-regulated signal transduction histidine kinase (bacteriophytochrome)
VTDVSQRTAETIRRPARGRESLADLELARAQVLALEQLLEVHERTALEQATNLEQAIQTQQELLAREQAARTALERSNRELDQFAYVASHDLKAPLRGIANLTQWLEEDLGDRVTGTSLEHMQLLKGRVARMEALIDGILAYSRAGRTRDKPERVDVGKLLSESIELLAPGGGIEIVVQPGMPTLETARVPLQQVFMNLLSNAIKHTKRPGARVEVSATRRDDRYEFAVADNGTGIDPQYHERIWQIFQTLAPRDKIEGTGIGLSVVQKIVDARGGRAWLESALGKGTTFYFTWPIHPDEQS